MKRRAGLVQAALERLRRLGWIKLSLLAALALAVAYGVRRWYRYEPPIEVGLARDFRLGYNLDFPGDWTNLPPFIDQVKNARGFEGGCAEGEECHPTRHLDLDAQGWVRSMRFKDDPARAYQRVELIFNSSKERHDIGKPFVVTWRGQGELELRGPSDAAYDAERRRITFTLPPGVALLRITATDPQQTGDYLRDIRVFRADHEGLLAEGKLFDPDMLRFLAPFRSLRFMDWMQSNSPGRCSGGEGDGKECYAVTNEACGAGSACLMPGKWSERPTTDQAIWIHTGQFLDTAAPERGTKVGGYPIETLIALANELGAAPHFNLPAHADEEYTRELAALLKERLEPSLPISIEYSNEVWNWGFPQANYAKARAAELWPGVGTGWVQYMALRTHQMCRVFRQLFAGQEWRVRCLISPQTGWRGLAPEVLDCPSWIEKHPEDESCTKYVDAISISGYFGGCLAAHPEVVAEWLREGREAALNKAFQHLERGGGVEACEGDDSDSVEQAIDNYRHFMQLAARRGLGLEVYEGGTHFDYSAQGEAGDEQVAQFFVEVARDARMRDLYLRNYDGFRNAGGSTFNVWGWITPNDAWSNADSATDLRHPKYRAIAEFAERLATARAP